MIVYELSKAFKHKGGGVSQKNDDEASLDGYDDDSDFDNLTERTPPPEEHVSEVPAKKPRLEEKGKQSDDQETSQPGIPITIQIRMTGRQPLVLQCNTNDKVKDVIERIRELLQQQGNSSGGRNGVLSLATVYPRNILDSNNTLQQCGIGDRTVLALEIH